MILDMQCGHASLASVACTLVAACGSPDDARDAATEPDAAAAVICTPGVSQSVCPASRVIIACNALGTAWVETPCPAGESCFLGTCVDWPCRPGETGCQTPKLRTACLDDGQGSFSWQVVEQCSGLCDDGACTGACGFDVKPGIGEACRHFVLDLDGSPDNACVRHDLLAVPSSGDDRIAVFDLAVEPPALAPGSPFPTCDDPSRILVDADKHVVVTCRGDGRVNKHTTTGALAWSTALPGCNAVRGVVAGPAGRLFAGCTTTTDVHELDPDTGDVIDTVTTGILVYGLTIDQTGVYVTGSGLLAKVHILGGGMNVVWKVSADGYGIAADQAGRVWLAEAPGLVAYDTRDGTALAAVAVRDVDPAAELEGRCNGVAVALDGTVYTGCADSGDFVLMWDPDAERGEVLHLPSTQHHPRGVAVDPRGRLYTVNLESSDVTRFAVGDHQTLAFGRGALVGPYGYSGDMTALGACIFSGRVTWSSPVLDLGGPTRWLQIRWRASEPPGTSITVRYRLDDGPWVRVQSGMAIEATSDTLQIEVELESTTSEAAPHLDELAVYYRALGEPAR